MRRRAILILLMKPHHCSGTVNENTVPTMEVLILFLYHPREFREILGDRDVPHRGDYCQRDPLDPLTSNISEFVCVFRLTDSEIQGHSEFESVRFSVNIFGAY
jgi:hypothetical protein